MKEKLWAPLPRKVQLQLLPPRPLTLTHKSTSLENYDGNDDNAFDDNHDVNLFERLTYDDYDGKDDHDDDNVLTILVFLYPCYSHLVVTKYRHVKYQMKKRLGWILYQFT